MFSSCATPASLSGLVETAAASFSETLMCIQVGHLLLLVSGSWQQFLRPGAHFCLFFLLLGPIEMLVVIIRTLAYTTCSICPFFAGSTFPRAEDSPHLLSHVVPLLSELTGFLRGGALGGTGTKSCQWGSCLLSWQGDSPVQTSVLETTCSGTWHRL